MTFCARPTKVNFRCGGGSGFYACEADTPTLASQMHSKPFRAHRQRNRPACCGILRSKRLVAVTRQHLDRRGRAFSHRQTGRDPQAVVRRVVYAPCRHLILLRPRQRQIVTDGRLLTDRPHAVWAQLQRQPPRGTLRDLAVRLMRSRAAPRRIGSDS